MHEHARIYVRTRRLAGGERLCYAKCRCGWVATWPRTQDQARDAYRGHLRDKVGLYR